MTKEPSPAPSTLMEELLAEMESPCKLSRMLDSMSPELAEQTVAVLRERDRSGKRFSTASLIRLLAKRGIKADRHHINECRQTCDCPWNVSANPEVKGGRS